ncbi:MAG TPA: aromatic ring-hydroxylating dioxygenase subunit alpha [Steroidobacter sp.]|uniref:aromatic ring-hydroxylating dioxygenase subunit alpha n=1 Tax=Steroidobacter sp. TaxID=1978227 RepID=UPI002EDA2C02
MFLRQYWYVAALSRDIGRKPVTRRILGEDLVFYRMTAGDVVALRDRCPHRLAPLSLGEVVGDELQCRYHGMRFGKDGKCTAVPGENFIAPVLCVDTFPVAERHGLVWIWMGEAAKADPAQIPEWPWMEKSDFVHLHMDARVFNAPLFAIVDNLLDLTHIHFTHRLLGADNLVHDSEPMKVWREGPSVHFSRKLKRVVKPGVYAETRGSFHLPSVCYTRSMLREEESGELLPAPMTHVMHALTPATAESTNYLIIRSWNALTKPQDIAQLTEQSHVTIEEDREIVEAQQRVRNASPGVSDRLIRADAAAVDARRMYAEALRTEEAAVAA